MMKRGLASILILAALWIPCQAGNWDPASPPHIADNFEISLGNTIYTCLGGPELFVPIIISTSQPTTHVYLQMLYDPTCLTPSLLAPNMFFQRFAYDISAVGKIKMDLITELPPPPDIPPLMGDTIMAWISFRITSCEIGYDYLTHITFYEDPMTPYPDNYIVLENHNIIASPPLVLTPGSIVLEQPLYGDINLNEIPFEIADAVTFLNFLMGYAPFNRCQYANSDCNRDCIQASIADLVYLINVINGDTVPGAPPILQPNADALAQPLDASWDFSKGLDRHAQSEVYVNSQQLIGGATLMFDFNADELSPISIVPDTAASYMQFYSSVQGNKLVVTAVNWSGRPATFSNGRLFSILYSGNNSENSAFKIETAEFADNSGVRTTAEYNIEGSNSTPIISAVPASLSLGGYPNPFNSSISIRLSLPSDGDYQLAVYDILGRKIKTLLSGFQYAGRQSIVWDGTGENESNVASGTYFLRLKGDNESRNMKLYLLK